MKSRERLSRLFNGQEIDRIPITAAIEQYCDTFDRRGFNGGFCYNTNPEISYDYQTIVHYHGQLFQILDGMKDIGMDGLHTIEAPPIGDCTISQARNVLGKDTILIGNIQYDDLARLSVDEIDQLVRLAIEEGRSGKFILSPSAGPYETTLTEKQVENYLAFIHAGVKYGQLSQRNK